MTRDIRLDGKCAAAPRRRRFRSRRVTGDEEVGVDLAKGFDALSKILSRESFPQVSCCDRV